MPFRASELTLKGSGIAWRKLYAQGVVPAGSVGILHGALGEPNEAFAWLEKASTKSVTLSSPISKCRFGGSGHCATTRAIRICCAAMQHWLAVYPPEFQIPMFFAAVD